MKKNKIHFLCLSVTEREASKFLHPLGWNLHPKWCLMNKYNCPNTCIDENTGKVRRRMPAANGLIPSHNGSLAFICRQSLDFTSTALPLQRKPESFEVETHSISSSHNTVHHWLIIHQHHTVTLTPTPQPLQTQTWTPCIVSLIRHPLPPPPPFHPSVPLWTLYYNILSL